MICPVCGNEIADGVQFCTKCGSRIQQTPPRRCARCGAPCAEGQSLCPTCLQIVNGQARPVQPKKSSAMPVIITVSVIAGLLLIGGLGYLGYSIAKGNLAMFGSGNNISAPTESEVSNVVDEIIIDSDVSELPVEESTVVPEITEETPEPTIEYTPEPEPDNEIYYDSYDSYETDPVVYFVTHCDSEYFTKDYFYGFDDDMCCIARNGVYARSGRKFNNAGIAVYFSQFDWYYPTIEPSSFSENMLNQYQKANLALVIEYEEEHGFR